MHFKNIHYYRKQFKELKTWEDKQVLDKNTNWQTERSFLM